MKWIIVVIIAFGLSACGNFRTVEKVDFEKQALIQVQDGDIIYGIDEKVVYSVFSQRKRGVTPGKHVILVTQFGDIRFRRGFYSLDVLAGLTYDIDKNRQFVKVSDVTGATVDELLLSPDDMKTFVSRAEYQRVRQAEQVKSNARMKLQAARMELEAKAADAERQIKRSHQLPLIRKIGSKICQRGMSSVGNEQIKVVSVGYVERITDDKVQIRISRMYFESNPSVSPGGFSPSIIWDDPMNWDLCQ